MSDLSEHRRHIREWEDRYINALREKRFEDAIHFARMVGDAWTQLARDIQEHHLQKEKL